MINHVVLFKLKACPAKEKVLIIEKFKSMLLGLKGKIDVLKHIEVGENYELEAKSFDLALITHFESIEDLNSYAVHPEHVKVTDFAREVVEARAAVDFNF
ncbi:Dabb family protein [Maribellus sp. YY47]|uniref:Dabb family protein n=1 Tax=Maribellus sp. YY47 TaxID=2929486 RepID=UPI0020007A4C|nr:Dabb family protein [Maribellus sp. YY47]MCK3682896.1 Dabb family protein [Maribellus sp. YY47]